jgi:hypothetical protein
MQNQPNMPGQYPVQPGQYQQYQQQYYPYGPAIPQTQSFTNKAVTAMFLYLLFYFPGLIAAAVWFNEARHYAEQHGVKPYGYTLLMVVLILGLIPIVLAIILAAVLAIGAIWVSVLGGH